MWSWPWLSAWREALVERERRAEQREEQEGDLVPVVRARRQAQRQMRAHPAHKRTQIENQKTRRPAGFLSGAAAAQGFEPQLLDPESSVLPLDDAAMIAHSRTKAYHV